MSRYSIAAILVCLCGLLPATSAWAEEDDWFEAKGWGSHLIETCQNAVQHAKELCEDIEDAGVEIDRSFDCVKSCEGGIGNYTCTTRYRCDASKRPRKTNRQMNATGTARLPLELNPCDAAKRDAKKQMREECEELDGYLEDSEAGDCNCRPLTFRATGEPAAECEVEVSAICNRAD